MFRFKFTGTIYLSIPFYVRNFIDFASIEEQFKVSRACRYTSFVRWTRGPASECNLFARVLYTLLARG